MEDTAGFSEDSDEQPEVKIIGSELVENYTVYIIEVSTGLYNWTVKHRYSDFYDLHEKLTSENKIEWSLLPPKKIIGKNSKSLVEKRQKDLEVYLQALLTKFPASAPKALSQFLHFHLYEIHGIAAVLAEELFHNGEQLLVAGEVFHMRPLQLYAITQLLRHAKPTCINGDAKTDLGHILDFTCRLKYLKISGTRGPVGTSNLQEHLLPYDLSVFKSLSQVEICHSDAKLIQGFTSCKKTLATMTVQFSTSSLKDILVPEALEFDNWEAEGSSPDCPITAVVPKWSALTTVDMSHNQIASIDDSVKLTPQVEFLALSHNYICSIENLQHLYNLVHLDLSYNKLSVLEGVHSKIGNIKTLNLSGNLLESLRGLNKLYSLVNLDLGNNKISQVDEIKNLGSLPCIETVNLTDNPVTIVPDYRTKVLAQFGDRAAEVCLDNTSTTEKELDTVEVLKAIQKAKEAKNKLNNADKKMSEDCRLTSASSSFPVNASSSPVSRPVIPSQDKSTISKFSGSLTHIDRPSSQQKREAQQSLLDGGQNTEEITSDDSLPDNKNLNLNNNVEKESPLVPDLPSSPFPLPCVSYSITDEDFIPYLSTSIAHALKQKQHLAGVMETPDNPRADHRCREPGDGYFEMGLHEREQGLSGRPLFRDPDVSIKRVLWNFTVHLRRDCSIKPFPSCLVVTDTLLALFEMRHDQRDQRIFHPSTMKLVGYYYYEDLTEMTFLIPESCLALSVRNGEEFVIILTDPRNLEEFWSCLQSQKCLTSPHVSSALHGTGFQGFFRKLIEKHQIHLSDCEVKGYFPVCLFYGEDSEEGLPVENTILSPNFCVRCSKHDVSEQNGDRLCPVWLVLTPQDMVIIRIDFRMICQDKSMADYSHNSFRLSRIPMTSVVVHPSHRYTDSEPAPQDSHILRFILDSFTITASFLLPNDVSNFLPLYKLLRSSVQDVKSIVVLKSLNMETSTEQILEKKTQRQTLSPKPQMTLPTLYPSESLFQKLSEENQIPFHLATSPHFRFISALNGRSIVDFFHCSIAEVDNEELRYLMWSSVTTYRLPDAEMTSCVLLSTKAIYFVLDDTFKRVRRDLHDDCNQLRSGSSCAFYPCYCIAIPFNDLQSVNIGLFDQFFRITGSSPNLVVTCLTRDSYTTHAFIQHLMSALTLLERTPSPEPIEKDFYSEFGQKKTGKMENYELIHSSRVKFIYPNEEEIGDLTYIVTEQNDTSGVLPSLNILLYVLAFHVNSAEGPDHEALLQPRTLILTSSDLFLFNEDYISYPLPDFAKEPPKKDKYQLMDGRRIRDLDRVLMGYQTYPQTLTFVFDDSSNQDLMHSLSMDHFGDSLSLSDDQKPCVGDKEVQWYIFIPSADCREKLISLLARQWEILCGRELPLELTG
ncbi:nischarin isoform 2-T2 [Anomaloglossus baeobatrachus]|uniref:nischarin isoform X2 n=1 Tax=Anomaloglossus baeobatrachus TaxID=238106 RepID=UPI003F508A25